MVMTKEGWKEGHLLDSALISVERMKQFSDMLHSQPCRLPATQTQRNVSLPDAIPQEPLAPHPASVPAKHQAPQPPGYAMLSLEPTQITRPLHLWCLFYFKECA